MKTVFVLGAGASKEVDLPVGSELTEKISTLLDFQFDRPGERRKGDAIIAEAISKESRKTEINIDLYYAGARRIHEGMPLAASIDNFLDAHRGDSPLETCGKLAIVRSILDAERKSKLMADKRHHQAERLDTRKVRSTWFKIFWELFSENCTPEHLAARIQSVRFVIFNYDRCLEQFIAQALQAYYDLPEDTAGELLESFTIYRPYGSVGKLTLRRAGPIGVPFGHEVGGPGLLDLAGGIKTFTEGTNPDSSDIVGIRDSMKWADRIVFLGFAYHPLNLQLLWPENISPDASSGQKLIYGSACGLSENDIQIVRDELQRKSGFLYPPVLDDMTCSKFFHQYRRSLSLL